MFLIFGGAQFYASGGGFDLLGTEATSEDALLFAEKCIGCLAITEVADWSDDRDDDLSHEIEWTHVVDGDSGEMVAEFGCRPYGGGAKVLEIRET